MASLIAKSEGHADKNGTLISQDPLKYQIDFGQPEASNVVWNIIYDNGEGCSGETQYTVNGTGSCTNVTISCVPTEKQLQDGSAATVITVTSNGNACTRKFYCEQETGHPQHNSGYEFTAHTAGTYVFRSVDDTGKTCTFLVTQPAVCEITSITLERSSYEMPYDSTDYNLAKNKVTIGYENCATAPTWEAYYNDSSTSYITSGMNNTYFIPPRDGEFKIQCVEKTSLSSGYTVTKAPPPYVISGKAGQGGVTLTINGGEGAGTWSDESWHAVTNASSISLTGSFPCEQITGLTLDIGLGALRVSNYTNITVGGESKQYTPSGDYYSSDQKVYMEIHTNSVIVHKNDDPDCTKRTYSGSYTMELDNGASVDISITLSSY